MVFIYFSFKKSQLLDTKVSKLYFKNKYD
jgi:hypothetical protein